VDALDPGERTAARAARGRLRQRLHREPGDLAAREELARLHRAAGQPDQAGRWGLLVPGLATAAEKQAFAVWTARTAEPGGSDHDRLLRLLFVPRTFTAAEVDPAGALPEFEVLLRRETRRHTRAATTSVGGWLADTAAGAVGATLLGALVGGAASATYAIGEATDSPLVRTSSWPSWTELWVAVAVLTLGLVVTVVVGSMITLAVRLPDVLRHRERRARRRRARGASRERAERRVDATPGNAAGPREDHSRAGRVNAALIIASGLLVWLCVIVLNVALAEEPADCEVWCSSHVYRDTAAFLGLGVFSLLSFILVLVRSCLNGIRSRLAWLAVLTGCAQVLVFVGFPFSPGWTQ